MLFVADVIPPELRRIVEFLNGQMDPAQVLAVEIKHFVGQDLKTLVPTVFGQTAKSVATKGTGGPTKKPLSEDELQQVADERGVGELYASLVRKLRPVVESTNTTASNIAFLGRNGNKRPTIISLIPMLSTASRGVRFGAYPQNIGGIAGTDEEKVIPLLRNCDTFNAGYVAGFADSDGSLDLLIELLRRTPTAGMQA
jgi:hypothetical protein